MKVNYKEENGQKNIAITNTIAEECFIRLKILTPSDVNIELMQNAQNWEMDGEYWNYKTVLGGNTTIQVPLEINDNNQEDRKIGNVIIVVERTRVLQDSEGNSFVDWEEIEEE